MRWLGLVFLVSGCVLEEERLGRHIGDGLHLELSWDTETDLDLHMLDNGEDLWTPGDVNFCNRNPDWGEPGGRDDPSLVEDVTPGFGPEITTFIRPSDGMYTPVVHYFGRGSHLCLLGCPATTATVSVYLDGELEQTFSRTIQTPGDTWTVADIVFPTGAITGVDTLGSTSEHDCLEE